LWKIYESEERIMAYNIGIRECRKCDNNIRCEECVFPNMAERAYQENVELRKNKWIAIKELKAKDELIKQLKAEIAELKRTVRAKARLLYLEGEPADNNLYVNIRDIESFLKEQVGE
jgi:predicted transcriptional regulator